jgi:hypothetical protein
LAVSESDGLEKPCETSQPDVQTQDMGDMDNSNPSIKGLN